MENWNILVIYDGKQNNATENFVVNFVPEGWCLATMCILSSVTIDKILQARWTMSGKTEWKTGHSLLCNIIQFHFEL